MAEALAAIGAIASVGQLADFGFQLSIKLFAFGEAVANADRSVKSLSNELSLTAAVLRELSEVLGSDGKHVSPRAVEATEKTECHSPHHVEANNISIPDNTDILLPDPRVLRSVRPTEQSVGKERG